VEREVGVKLCAYLWGVKLMRILKIMRGSFLHSLKRKSLSITCTSSDYREGGLETLEKKRKKARTGYRVAWCNDAMGADRNLIGLPTDWQR
jgi:hypothetical protein